MKHLILFLVLLTGCKGTKKEKKCTPYIIVDAEEKSSVLCAEDIKTKKEEKANE